MRIRLLLCLALMGLVSGVQAQTDTCTSYARSVIDSLTSQRFAGRGYQDNGHLIAAEFIAGEFKRLGLSAGPGTDGTYLQPFPLVVYMIDSASLTFDGGKTRLVPGKDFIVHTMSKSGTASDGFSAPIWGIPDDFTSRKHKICIIREGLPPGMEKDKEKMEKYQAAGGESAKLDWASKAGYSAVILLKKDLTAGYIRQPGDIPVLEVLEDRWPKKFKSVTVMVAGGFRKIQTQNVIAGRVAANQPNLIPADSCIIVSAHYDHLGKLGDAWFPGGNDNAVGIAMMLDIASRIAKAPLPHHDVLFIAFGAEEAGLVGSRYYTEHPGIPLSSTAFILNLDLMGNGKDGMTAVGAFESPGPFNRLTHLNDSLGVVPLIKPRKNAPNSDQYYFILKGVSGFFLYTLGGPPWYHDVNDTGMDLTLDRYCGIRDFLTLFLRGF